MILWRISNYADLKGLGGLRAEGRWHSAGRPIVYLADHSASAILEMLVHCELDVLPPTYQLLKVEVPDDAILNIDPAALPGNWRDDQDATQSIGDTWLVDAPSLLLCVPSALTPDGQNYLLNPDHPDAGRCHIHQVRLHPLDPRFGVPKKA